MPVFGDRGDRPSRREELPYDETSSPLVVPVVLSAAGPPKLGTDGLTLATSAGSTLTRARSLYWQGSASFSPSDCMVSQELYTRGPGRLAPSMSTGVPTGSEWEVQPLVAVLPSVPEQWAAWPM